MTIYMSLPNIAQLEFNIEEITDSTESKTIHKTLLWDFEEGDFALKDGKVVIVESKDYIKVWIRKALLTIENTLIYKETNYGSGHYSLIGTNFKPTFTKEEYKRTIKEALLFNDAITNVYNFTFTQNNSRMIIGFEVDSIYGRTNEVVTV